MAQGFKMICSGCEHSIETWDEGNPYYIDENGKKCYAYHPSPDRGRCIGNDAPHFCMSCGQEFMVDSRVPTAKCPKCDDSDIAPTMELDDRTCPHCRAGVFVRGHYAIS